MALKILFLAPIVLLILQGCAFNDYKGSSERSALANICEQEGYITYKEFAYYTSFQLGEYAHQNMQQVDDEKLRSMYISEVEKLNRYNLKSPESRQNLRTVCANISVVAERVRPQNNYQAQQQETAVSQINQIGNNMRQAGNQALQQSNAYATPAVAPMNINPMDNNKVRNCYTISNIEYCK